MYIYAASEQEGADDAQPASHEEAGRALEPPTRQLYIRVSDVSRGDMHVLGVLVMDNARLRLLVIGSIRLH